MGICGDIGAAFPASSPVGRADRAFKTREPSGATPVPDWAVSEIEDGADVYPASQMYAGPRWDQEYHGNQFYASDVDVNDPNGFWASQPTRVPHDGGDLADVIEQGEGVVQLNGDETYWVPDTRLPIHVSHHRLRLTGGPDSEIRREDTNDPLIRYVRGPRKQMGHQIDSIRFFEPHENGNSPLLTNMDGEGRTGSLIEDFLIRDVEFKDIRENGVILFERAPRVKIEHTKFDFCESAMNTDNRGIIHLTRGSADPHINRCTFNLGDSGSQMDGIVFHFETGGEPRTNGGARLENTVIMRADRSLKWDGIWQVAVSNVVFDGHLRPPLFTGVGTIRVSDISTTGWRGAHGMVIIGGDNHSITNSRFQFSSGNIGLNLINAVDCTISNCTFKHFERGLRIAGCRHVTASNNVCSRNSGVGLHIDSTARSSEHITVDGGISHSNGAHGVAIEDSHHVSVSDMRVYGNNIFGINVTPGCTNIQLRDNDVYRNSTNINWSDPGGNSDRSDNNLYAPVGHNHGDGHEHEYEWYDDVCDSSDGIPDAIRGSALPIAIAGGAAYVLHRRSRQ